MVPYPGAISNGVSDGWSGGFLVSLRVVMRVLMSISVRFFLVWGVGLENVDLMRCWLRCDSSLSPSWLDSWRYWHSGASLGWSLWENIAQEPLLIHDNGSRFRW
jgi:hypothetical protein